MPETIIDLTGSESRGSGHPRLQGLRPLIDMPAWGIEGDASSPVPTQHVRDLFCAPWNTQERTEAPYPSVAAVCIDLAYPGDAPARVVPAPCVMGNVGGTPVLFLPFKVELPRDADWCEDPDGAKLAARAVGRVAELAELALLRQLWSASIEPRGTSLAAFAEDHSAAGALSPRAAYAKLTTMAEEANHTGWTLLGPVGAKAAMSNASVIRRGDSGWLDVHDQPVVFGGQAANWAPTNTAGPGPRTAAAGDGSDGYLGLAGPVWFALSDPADALPRGPQPDEALRSTVSTRPSVKGIVMTRVHDVHVVRTDLS